MEEELDLYRISQIRNIYYIKRRKTKLGVEGRLRFSCSPNNIQFLEVDEIKCCCSLLPPFSFCWKSKTTRSIA